MIRYFAEAESSKTRRQTGLLPTLLWNLHGQNALGSIPDLLVKFVCFLFPFLDWSGAHEVSCANDAKRRAVVLGLVSLVTFNPR